MNDPRAGPGRLNPEAETTAIETNRNSGKALSNSKAGCGAQKRDIGIALTKYPTMPVISKSRLLERKSSDMIRESQPSIRHCGNSSQIGIPGYSVYGDFKREFGRVGCASTNEWML